VKEQGVRGATVVRIGGPAPEVGGGCGYGARARAGKSGAHARQYIDISPSIYILS